MITSTHENNIAPWVMFIKFLLYFINQPLLSNIVALALVSFTLMPSFMYAQISAVNSTYILIGDSMYPNIRSNDGVVVDTHFPFNNLSVGDIIVFNSYDTTNRGQHVVIIHRVVQIINDRQGDRIIGTKGDANPDSIPGIDYPVFQQNYIGKVVSVIPKLGVTSANNGATKIINGVAKNATYNDLLVVATIGSAGVLAGYIYRKIHK
ncbi:MAG: signal peptidase I [Candidatus Nitrosopolaris sp.]|jgi:signal peptidase I